MKYTTFLLFSAAATSLAAPTAEKLAPIAEKRTGAAYQNVGVDYVGVPTSVKNQALDTCKSNHSRLSPFVGIARLTMCSHP